MGSDYAGGVSQLSVRRHWCSVSETEINLTLAKNVTSSAQVLGDVGICKTCLGLYISSE